MTSRFPKSMHYFLIAAILVVAVLAVPSTNAKYAKESKYNINIVTEAVANFFFATTNGDAQTVTLPSAGRYLIIVKGGDGSDGRGNGVAGTSTVRYADFTELGGLGGTVTAIYTASSANEKLYVCPGTAGTRPANNSNDNNYGAGGTNAGAQKYSGGRGSKSSTSFADPLSTDNSGPTSASGGGGAASVVYSGTSRSGTLLMVAGGGGAAGCHHLGWNSYNYTQGSNIFGQPNYSYYFIIAKGGNGGAGGSGGGPGTVTGTAVTVTSGTIFNQTTTTVGYMFSGSDGSKTDTTSNKPYGSGGSTSAGAYGTAAALRGVISAQNGSAGNTSTGTGNGTGNGNGGNANVLGGGGGGGYAGGGGGTGCSIEKYGTRQNAITSNHMSSGGGGGGSSFISNQTYLRYTGFTSEESTAVTTAMNKAQTDYPVFYADRQRNGATSPILPSVANDHIGDGYVIIYYIGA